MRKFTKAEIKKLKIYWKELQVLEADFDFAVRALESLMQRDLQIDDVEFFASDDGYCGIGNVSRTIKLVQRDKLEKE